MKNIMKQRSSRRSFLPAHSRKGISGSCSAVTATEPAVRQRATPRATEMGTAAVGTKRERRVMNGTAKIPVEEVAGGASDSAEAATSRARRTAMRSRAPDSATTTMLTIPDMDTAAAVVPLAVVVVDMAMGPVVAAAPRRREDMAPGAAPGEPGMAHRPLAHLMEVLPTEALLRTGVLRTGAHHRPTDRPTDHRTALLEGVTHIPRLIALQAEANSRRL